MQTKFKTYQWDSMLELRTWKLLGVSFALFLITACSDFLSVDLPNDRLTSETVFEDAATAEAVLINIYGKMRDSGLLGGRDLNVIMGYYTDELEPYRTSSSDIVFQDHNVKANTPTLLAWWSAAYNQIYAANDVIEGVERSEALTAEQVDQFKGEALFIRGYLHLLLTELFGDVPYIESTDYLVNTKVSRMPQTAVYEKLIKDLDDALDLLPETRSSEKTRPYRAVADAVLARAYLYTGQWALADAAATKVINTFGGGGVINPLGGLEADLDRVFLKGSSETIWQFKSNRAGFNALEASVFIFTSGPPVFALNPLLLEAFDANDQRKDHWIGTVQSTTTTDTWYYAFKYKERFTTGTTSLEYSVQLRLAEQYLIRAEARAYQGDIPGAQADLNRIRKRAGLGNTQANTLETLLDKILDERRVELFTEKGHRWFDLKRMGKAKGVLEPIKSGWRDTDILLPIPEQELLLNPNLLPQNEGY